MTQNQSQSNSSFLLIGLIPNMVTMIGLCFGLSAIRFAIEGQFVKAASLLLVAGFLDGIDGRLARFLNSSSDFGAQLDSLIDFVNFGIVPGFIIYMWINSFADIRGFDWALVLCFAICMSLRLARFNVSMEGETQDPVLDKYFFQGIPAPCSAALSILPMILVFEFGNEYFFANPKFIISYCFALAIFTASTIPTISIKRIPIRNDYIYVTLLILGLIIIGLVIEPWLTLAIIGTIYILSIPITTISYIKIRHFNKNDK